MRRGNVVVKSGKSITKAEAEALRLAERLRLPTPRIHSVERDEIGDMRITMEYIEGDILENVWPSMTEKEKKAIARQLRGILYAMRAAPPPLPPSTSPGPGSSLGGRSREIVLAASYYPRQQPLPKVPGKHQPMIASCGGSPVRDAHHYFDYDGGPFATEADFNEFLLSTLIDNTPSAIVNALRGRLRENHRIVFTHGDLSQRNILVRNGKIVALVDWEYAGWYPEYWEYVKFLSRFCRHHDWRSYAEDMFPVKYGDELVDYIALNHWQRP